MGFAGNLRTLALPEVLQTLNRIQATGVLRLASAEGGRDVVFDQGELIGVLLRRGEERQALLRRLVLDKRLDADTVAQISASGRESQIVARLVETGAVEQTAVQEAVRRSAEEELQSLFTWDYADFVFHDARPDDPEIAAIVERARAGGMAFNINGLLMESARRQDDWVAVRKLLPDGGLVLGPREGMEAQIAAASRDYPAAAVLPLVDAVRSIDDIVRDSVASRLDAWTCLARLMEQGLVVPLTRDDIVYHADYLASQNDHARASVLYRRALAGRPTDGETARKLAGCLERLGDAPEAAASWAQLALGALGGNDAESAVAHARRAVQLAPADPQSRQALARCLLATDARAEAVGELLQLVEIFVGLDRLEDARSACLQVLELDKNNEPARRQLARLFSAAARDDQAEDVVVCVQCSHINHREAAACAKCSASLRLSCLACSRPVGVSDRICIFCGADPHRGSTGRRSGGSPATSRLVNPDRIKVGGASGGRQAVIDQLDAASAEARAREEAGDWQGALEAWKLVAGAQTDNPELLARIRELESRVHDAFVEEQIEKGHRYRRVRRYWMAARCYTAALRTMPSDDPRTQRLVEILASTRRIGNRIALVYAAAILVVVVGAVAALQPMLKQRRLAGEADALTAAVQAAGEANDGARLVALRGDVAAFSQQVEALGDGERWQGLRTRAVEVGGAHQIAWQRALVREQEQIRALIDQGDLVRARERLAAFEQLYQERTTRTAQLGQALEAAQKRRDEQNLRSQEAPRHLAAAEAEEAAGRPGPALAQYRGLAEGPNAEVAAKARAAVARLSGRAEAASGAVQQALDAAQAARTTDLARADALLAAAAEPAEQWGLGDRIRAARVALAAEAEAARTEAGGLGASAKPEQLASFLERFPGAAEAAAVRQRLAGMQRASSARTQAETRWRQLLAEQKWEQAWLAGNDFVKGYGRQVGDLRLPLWIETVPAGAAVTLDGKAAGTTPCVLLYAPGQTGTVAVALAGYQAASRRLDESAASWRLALPLMRAVLWRSELGKPATALGALPSGEVAAATADGIVLVAASGKVKWRAALGGDDLGAGRERAELPTALPDGRFVAALPGSGAALINAAGAVQRLPTTGTVRGRPAAYVNDVLGPAVRVAFAAEAIFSGEPGGQLTRIPLAAAAISGPLAIAHDIDRALVVADTRGRLVAYLESTRKALWELPVQAADIGHLVPLGDSDLVAVLDGVRLACFSTAGRAPALRWTHQLEAPAVGDPVVSGGTVLVGAGNQIVRVAANGAAMPALRLPAAAATAPAAGDDRTAIGCADGSVVFFRGGEAQWSSPAGAAPTAVAVAPAAVLVSTAAGALIAFAP